MRAQTLSSVDTFVSKFIFPSLWGALTVWLGATASISRGMELWALMLWVVGTGFVLALSLPLKRVRVDDRFIYISNYWREISVPLNMIGRVAEIRWIRGRLVIIYFTTETGFGDHITFAPNARFFAMGYPFRSPRSLSEVSVRIEAGK